MDKLIDKYNEINKKIDDMYDERHKVGEKLKAEFDKLTGIEEKMELYRKLKGDSAIKFDIWEKHIRGKYKFD